MNLRIDPDTRQPIEQAAAALGKTRTEFIVDTAKRAAIDMLLDRRLFVLDPDEHRAFMRRLGQSARAGTQAAGAPAPHTMTRRNWWRDAWER
jgi:uncharacterized protein (DUF1778 family)